MDGQLLIIMPKENYTKFDFKVPVFEWGGEKYEQGPPEYKFGKNFLLRVVVDENIGKILSVVPVEYQEVHWIVIEVLGDGLDLFIDEQYRNIKKEEENYRLKDLLNVLLIHAKKWMIIFSYQYDGFKKVNNGTIQGALHSIAFEFVGGFLIYGKE